MTACWEGGTSATASLGSGPTRDHQKHHSPSVAECHHDQSCVPNADQLRLAFERTGHAPSLGIAGWPHQRDRQLMRNKRGRCEQGCGGCWYNRRVAHPVEQPCVSAPCLPRISVALEGTFYFTCAPHGHQCAFAGARTLIAWRDLELLAYNEPRALPTVGLVTALYCSKQ